MSFRKLLTLLCCVLLMCKYSYSEILIYRSEKYTCTIYLSNDYILDCRHSQEYINQDNYEKFKNEFSIGCTHIIGDLNINDAYQNDVLDFFQFVKEIFGSLSIERNRIKSIRFPSLRVIRKDLNEVKFSKSLYSLKIFDNHFEPLSSSYSLYFPNLTSILNGNIIINENKNICGQRKIDWNQLLQNPERQIINIDDISQCFDASCSHKCKSLNCWDSDTCQKDFSCSRSINCRWCYWNTKLNESHCCHEQCTGGCFGPASNQCHACINFEDENGNCVSQCPLPMLISNIGSQKGLKLNPDFRYRLFHECVKECPIGMLIEKTNCVFHCSTDTHIQEERFCRPCNGICPKVCDIEMAETRGGQPLDYLDGNALQKLKGCTTIHGDLIVSSASFNETSDGIGFIPIRSENEFEVLKDVRTIIGAVYLDFKHFPGPPLKNLSFLRNLYSVQLSPNSSFGANESVFYIANSEIEFLGLTSLYEITQGYMRLSNNSELCYINTFAQNRSSLDLKKEQMKSISNGDLAILSDDTATQEKCASKKCHNECDSRFGCWGPSRNHCIRCRSWRADSLVGCVSSCEELPGFTNYPPKMNQVSDLTREQLARFALDLYDSNVYLSQDRPNADHACMPCHPECLKTCSGPGPNHCDGPCKHFKEEDNCVKECSIGFYQSEDKKCSLCASSCVLPELNNQTTCSGPENIAGPGGCDRCIRLLEINANSPFVCLMFDEQCPEGYFLSLLQDPHYSGAREICKPCHPLCMSCSAFTTKNASLDGAGCIECSGFWHKGLCLELCPSSETYTRADSDWLTHFTMNRDSSEIDWRQGGELRNKEETNLCLSCHEECLSSCFGPNPDNCYACLNFRLALKKVDGTWYLECIKECPDESMIGFIAPDRNTYCINESLEQKLDILKSVLPPEAFKSPLNESMTEELWKQRNKLYQTSGDRRLNKALSSTSIIGGLVILLLILTITVFFIRIFRWKKHNADVKTGPVSPSTMCKIICFGTDYLPVFTQDKEFSPPDQPMPGANAPNLSRLKMIQIDELNLDTCTLLGRGAFGAVYRGVWMARVSQNKEILSWLEATSSSSNSDKNGSSASSYPTQTPSISPTLTESTTNSSSGVYYPPILSNEPILDRDNGDLSNEKSSEQIQVAIKILNGSQYQESELQEFLDEAKFMASVRHRHCLPLLGVCVGGSALLGGRCLISQFVPHGSLDRYLEIHRKDINAGELLDWCRQIADGMVYLQSKGIVHRDLASRNVLVASRQRLQLTDFGLAKMLDTSSGTQQIIVRSGRVPIRWLAIETLRYAVYSFKTDVWAYGITLWEIFTFGQRPYVEIPTENISQHVLSGGRLPQPYVCTIQLYRVMLACWEEVPEKRPTFEELYEQFRNFSRNPHQYVHPKSVSSDRSSLFSPGNRRQSYFFDNILRMANIRRTHRTSRHSNSHNGNNGRHSTIVCSYANVNVPFESLPSTQLPLMCANPLYESCSSNVDGSTNSSYVWPLAPSPQNE